MHRAADCGRYQVLQAELAAPGRAQLVAVGAADPVGLVVLGGEVGGAFAGEEGLPHWSA